METIETTTIKKRGRKPVADKKKIVSIYLRQSEIEKYGGLSSIREKINNFLNSQQ
jgi:hypothetical protein